MCAKISENPSKWVRAAHRKALLLGAPVQELLDEVVAEGVHHELDEVLQHFRQHRLDGRSPALIKLALQEAAAVLVLGHSHHLQESGRRKPLVQACPLQGCCNV